jgi:hypothetical protein
LIFRGFQILHADDLILGLTATTTSSNSSKPQSTNITNLVGVSSYDKLTVQSSSEYLLHSLPSDKMGSTGTVGWDPDSLRTKFSHALSEMYKKEVPLYADLIDIINEVDDKVLQARRTLSPNSSEVIQELPSRHRLERHGAIRLGTVHELRTIRRLFAVLGMHPVGYYDLSVVGFPLHATAFRPLTARHWRRILFGSSRLF